MRLIRFFQSFFLIAVCCLLFSLFPQAVFAQNSSDTSVTTTYEPNTNADVPLDQHTLAQTVTIDVLSAVICQLTGIDPMSPDKGCLGYDPATKKIGYVQPPPGQIGGLLGGVSGLYSAVYTQPASGVTYLASTMDNFGIVKSAQAQGHGPNQTPRITGFDQLQPVQDLWQAVRNLTYMIFVVIFILLGVGIMLRVKIDPRTVMTIQNQLPRIVVAILLITFSYSIVGIMIDTMWLGTYVGINLITPAAANRPLCDGALPLQESAFNNLLNNPLAFVNDIFSAKFSDPNAPCRSSGLFFLSANLGEALGVIVNDLVHSLINPSQYTCDWGNIFPHPGGGEFHADACFGQATAAVIGAIAGFFGKLVAIVAILFVTMRLWWALLKAYAYIIVYTITGPFWILGGLLPNSSLGLQGWLRTLTAKLSVFPVAAFFIIAARVVLDLYNPQSASNPETAFVPPLVGNISMEAFGPILAFAILLITPELLNMLNDALKAPANKYTGPAVTKGFGSAAGIVAAPTVGILARSMRVDHKTKDAGFLAGLAINRSNKLRSWVFKGSDDYKKAAETNALRNEQSAQASAAKKAQGQP